MLKKAISILLTVILIISIPSFAVTATAKTDNEPTISIEKASLCVGEPLVVSNPGNYSLRYYVDGKKVSTGSFVLSDKQYEKWITVKAFDGKKAVAEDKVYFSKLPVLYISTDDGEPITSKEEYKNGAMFIQNNTACDDAVYSGAIKIKGRGNSSWGWQKKPYRIKLDKKANLFGMGSNKNWVLLANYLDESLLRNATAFQIAEELGLVTMQDVWTDVILNGEYVGNYQLCEQIRIDEDRVDIFDWEDEAKDLASAVVKKEKKNGNTLDKDDLEDCLTEDLGWITSGSFTFDGKTYTVSDYYDAQSDISGGYLFELSDEYDEVSRFTTKTGLKIMLKSPEYLKTNGEMLAYVKQYWQDFENAYRSVDGYAETADGKKHYTELADLDSMVSFWLVMEITGNDDAHKKSRFAYLDHGDIIRFGPVWDFDWGGGSVAVGNIPMGWKASQQASAQTFFKEFLDDPLFISRATEIYWKLRPFLQQLVDQGGVLDTETAYLYESGVADGAIWDRKQNWSTARGFVRDAESYKYYLSTRIKWLDQQFATEADLITSTYTENSAHPYTKSDDVLPITLLNARKDTLSANAPADGLVRPDKDVYAALGVGDPSVKSLDVYVNGRFCLSASSAAGRTGIKVPQSCLTAAEGEKNVISVIGRDQKGKAVYTNFATVIQKSAVERELYGDATGDGSINIMDATGIQRYLAGFPHDSFRYDAANLYGQGVNIMCATAIQRYLADSTASDIIGSEV